MGVLESRVLDFETVIITSVNEGKFPAGKSMNSFIPYDVKRELGLPTFKEKDAIYTYHFYHLLQRAKNVYLLYNSDSEGLDAGEKSRFITQLEVEKQPKHNLSFQINNADVPNIASQPMLVPKSESVMQRLKEIAEKVNLPFEKVKTNMDRYANTSGGTVPIILDEVHRNKEFKTGDILLFAAVGAGWTWGTALYKW